MAIPFADVCTLLSRLESIETHDPPLLQAQRHERSHEVIESWFKSHRSQIDALTVQGGTALLSTLLPEWRTDRVYGIQVPGLYRILCRGMEVGVANRPILEQYKQPGYGDIGQCLERVMQQGGPPAKPPITVDEVDEMLHMLAGGNRYSSASIPRLPPGSSGQRDRIIGNILFRCEPNHGKWLARLILKDLSPVRVDEKLVLRSFHFLLPDLLQFQCDFHAAVTLLKDELQRYPAHPDRMSERLHKTTVSARMRPTVGTKIGRPTFEKARDVRRLLKTLAGRRWAVERKYDGEYCEVHIDLQKSTDPNKCIKIFAKSGKDSTQDKKGLHATLVECLRLGKDECRFKRHAILLGEMVVYSDKTREIQPFEKIRKYVPRAGTHIGTHADSQPREDEHLAIVFFDLLLLDDEIVMNRPVDERRMRLRETYVKIPGRAFSTEWKIIDFNNVEAGERKLLDQFAAAIARRTEGLVIKPLGKPYFSLEGMDSEHRFIKLKRDFLKGLGDEADFAVIGASYNAQQAAACRLKAVKWTTFHLGCLVNQHEVRRVNARPMFKHVGFIDQEQCIPDAILEAANIEASFRSRAFNPLHPNAASFDVQFNPTVKIDVFLDHPLVFEVLGSGFVKPSNSSFYMLRHARVTKMHQDRTWLHCVTFEELQCQAKASRETPSDSESQETRRWARKLESLVGKCGRKFEQMRTPPSMRLGTTPPLTAERSEQLVSLSHSPAKRITHLLPTPLPSSDVVEVLGSPSSKPLLAPCSTTVSKRSREHGIEPCFSRKKRRIESPSEVQFLASRPTSTTPLLVLTNNTDPDSAREISKFARSSGATSELTRHVMAVVRGNQRPSPPLDTGPAAICKGTRCPFATATVFLVPCIAKALYICEDLLCSHNIMLTDHLSHWDRDSFQHRSLSDTISESQSHPGMRKMVLVERRRRAAVKATVQQILRLNGGKFRERIDVYDWRVLEACEKHDRGPDTVKKHFMGATVFDDTRKQALFVSDCGWL